jgi:hypothetical protein
LGNLQIYLVSGFGGLGVACWPLVPKFVGSDLVKAVGYLQVKKILSMPSFGWEVKPLAHVVDLQHVKDPLNGVEVVIWQNYQTPLSPTVPPVAARISHVITDVEASGSESGNV